MDFTEPLQIPQRQGEEQVDMPGEAWSECFKARRCRLEDDVTT